MYEINHNIAKVELGETICYHIGNLAFDRGVKEILGHEQVEVIKTDKKTGEQTEVFKTDKKTGEQTRVFKTKTIYGERTNDAVIADNVAEQLYLRSTAIWDLDKDRLYGTGEFCLFQKKLGYDKYAYLAKKISNKPVIRTS